MAGTRYQGSALYVLPPTPKGYDVVIAPTSFAAHPRLSAIAFQALNANPGGPFTDVFYHLGTLAVPFLGPNLLVTSTAPEPAVLGAAAAVATGRRRSRRPGVGAARPVRVSSPAP